MTAPPRCLHVVESLGRNAVESWLLRMLRHARATDTPVAWTFYSALPSPGAFDDEARSLGANVVHSPVPMARTKDFVRALRAELVRGRYQVLHGHHDLVNSVYLLASLRTSVTRRVSHVHNADESVPTPSALKQMLYREPMRQLNVHLADRVVGISDHTLDTFLNGRQRREGRDVVHYYGVDPSRFADLPNDSLWLRRAIAIPDDAPIMLFAGRLVPEKNPTFAVDVLASLRDMMPGVIAVFAGSGSDEQRVVARARELGVKDSIRMIGWREDLPAVMAAADCFILPHPDTPVEGFGLAVVEAQLAGLPLLLSMGVPNDPLLPTALYRRLPLSAGAHSWAEAAVELLSSNKPQRDDVLESLQSSPMEMNFALRQLLSLHT